MNKEGFNILIKAIDEAIFEIVLSGVLKGRASERCLNTTDAIEKDAYIALQDKARRDIDNRQTYIRNMLTNFMNNTKGENDE